MADRSLGDTKQTDPERADTERADPLSADTAHLEAWLDRLVDGEVSDPQRQELLRRLEQSPDGWRRCALAFLEGQAWREALDAERVVGRVSRPAPSLDGPGEPSNAKLAQPVPGRIKAGPSLFRVRFLLPQGGGPLAQRALGAVSVAACFLIAFGLGLLTNKTWLAPETDPSLAGGPSRGPSSSAAATGDDRSPGRWGKDRWGVVQFVVDGPGGTPSEVELPAIEGPDPDEFFRNQPPLLPPEIERALRQLGHRVETRRQYVPIPLEDGRRVVVPVDNVDVRVFGGRGYQ